MSTQIVLIRHGETAWNAERRLQGHLDIALNAEGLRQAEALADALAGERFDLVVASDLQRARQTAEAVASRHGLAVQEDADLRERCYGVFEGLLYADIERRYPRQFAAWQARDIEAVMPDGENAAESFQAFYARTITAIVAWGQAHPKQRVAMVAHGGVLECAYRAALGMALETPRTFAVKNASINRFTLVNGKLVLDSWGEVEHLAPAVLDEMM
jgi:2,3-bisphosphoglycerate-dependent phosphoglycerate mutase